MANDKNNRQLVVFGAPQGGSSTQIQSDWAQTDNTKVDYIKNKPTIPDAVSGTNDGTNWTSLTIGSVTKNIPSGGGAAQIQSDWTQTDNTQVDYIKNKPSLATVATSGSYSDLSNTPTIPDAVSGVNDNTNWTSLTIGSVTKGIPAAQVNADWNSSSGVSQILNKPSLATVATSGSYSDLSNTPSIPDAVSGVNDGTSWTSITIGSTTKAIPAAQVNADWNSSSGVSQILNKPSMTTETLTFIDTNNVETTVIVYTQPTV